MKGLKLGSHRWLIATAVCGMALLIIVFFNTEQSSVKAFLLYGTRELGFAMLIAVLVAVLFEFYQRSLEDTKTTQRNFDASMSDQLTPDVWKDVKKQVLKKTLLRKDAEVKFGVISEPGLLQDQMVLDLDFSYTLENLVTEEAKVEIEHELDYQLYYRDKDLPRFTRITIFAPDNKQSRDVEGPELKRLCPNGVLKLELAMPPKAAGRAAKIVTHRREVTHVPGSYNLYMTEYTKGMILRLDQPINGFDVEIKVRPEGVGQTLVRTGNTWRCDSLILPGQGVEIKFVDAVRRAAGQGASAAHGQGN